MIVRVGICVLLASLVASAGSELWRGEGKGMAGAVQSEGIVLVRDPLAIWQRSSRSGGGLPQDAFWLPGFPLFSPKGRARDNFEWELPPVGIFLRTGNEVGDALFQELDGKPVEGNRTPMMQLSLAERWGEVTTFGEFWQIDHYGGRWSSWRVDQTGRPHTHAWFGENRPAISRLWGGVQWGDRQVAMAGGKEFLWQPLARGDWLAVERRRWQAEWNGKNGISAQWISIDDAWVQRGLERGANQQWRGALFWQMGPCSPLQLGAGIQAEGNQPSGEWPIRYEDSLQLAPWVRIAQVWGPWRAAAWAGGAPPHWTHRDTLSWNHSAAYQEFRTEVRSSTGTQEDPFAPDTTVLEGHRQLLGKDGRWWIPSLLMQWDFFGVGWSSRVWTLPWGHYGAPLHRDVNRTDQSGPWVRTWEPGRKHTWLTGWQSGGRFSLQVLEIAELSVGGQVEPVRGDWSGVEVIPPPWKTWLEILWTLPTGLSVVHGVQWRGPVRWMGWDAPYTVPRTFVWNAALRQEFIEPGIELTAEWVHVLAQERAEAPGGEWDRPRFLVSASWAW